MRLGAAHDRGGSGHGSAGTELSVLSRVEEERSGDDEKRLSGGCACVERKGAGDKRRVAAIRAVGSTARRGDSGGKPREVDGVGGAVAPLLLPAELLVPILLDSACCSL
nr:unnamed protein product [Digitaria exilis]